MLPADAGIAGLSIRERRPVASSDVLADPRVSLPGALRAWIEEASSTRAYGGLGLGLAIVRHLTELHGGGVRAESPGEGKGTTFTVALPVRADRKLGVGERSRTAGRGRGGHPRSDRHHPEPAWGERGRRRFGGRRA